MSFEDRSSAEPAPTPQPEDGVGQAGIEICVWRPRNDLPTMRVFVAPRDLTDSDGNPLYATFQDASAVLCNIKGLLSHDGASFGAGYERDLFLAMQKEQYQGQWVVPPVAVLEELDNYLMKQPQGVHLAYSFGARTAGGRAVKTYGSCTPIASCGVQPSLIGGPPPDCSNTVRTVSLATGNKSWATELQSRTLWRAVRFAPA